MIDELQRLLDIVGNRGFPLILSVVGLYGIYRLSYLAIAQGLVPLLQAKASLANAAEETITKQLPRITILLEEMREQFATTVLAALGRLPGEATPEQRATALHTASHGHDNSPTA